MAGDPILARPTTATSETVSSPRLVSVARSLGGSACPSASRSTGWCSNEPAADTWSSAIVTGRKKSRCRIVWVKTNMP